jgi:hypothetical protein
MDRKTRQKFKAPSYGYGAVESALATVFGADSDVRESTLRARLKHFGRLGLPGDRGGKGTRMQYSFEQATQWLVALLMSDLGIDPVIIVKTIQKYWDSELARWVRQATDAVALAGNPVLLAVRPRSMSGAWLGKKSALFRTLPWVRAYRQVEQRHHLGAVGITVGPPEIGEAALTEHGSDKPRSNETHHLGAVGITVGPREIGEAAFMEHGSDRLRSGETPKTTRPRNVPNPAKHEWVCTCNLTDAVRELEAALEAGK